MSDITPIDLAMLASKHPRTLSGAIMTEPFVAWLKNQPRQLQEQYLGPDAADLLEAADLFYKAAREPDHEKRLLEQTVIERALMESGNDS